VVQTSEQRLKVKQMLVAHLHMRMAPADIGDDEALFGDEGLGFDSVDAIEMVAGIEQDFGYTFKDQEEARANLATVATLTEFLIAQGKL
jgi:acyl carrier protein